MKLISSSFKEGERIPGDFAFCIPDPAHHVCLGKNLNPQLQWSDVPAAIKSSTKSPTINGSSPTRSSLLALYILTAIISENRLLSQPFYLYPEKS